MKKISKFLIISCIAMLFIGCQNQIQIKPERAFQAPAIAYCHDGVGHIAGNIPWILNGNCCCTPTKEKFMVHQHEQTVPEDMAYSSYLQKYKDKGIVTDLDGKFISSNCRCEQGPHVVFGGNCMVTPTPGTLLYEEVTSGIRNTKN